MKSNQFEGTADLDITRHQGLNVFLLFSFISLFVVSALSVNLQGLATSRRKQIVWCVMTIV